MTEGYNGPQDCQMSGRYTLRKDLHPWELSNLSSRTTLRQPGVSRTANTTNTEAGTEAETGSEAETGV